MTTNSEHPLVTLFKTYAELGQFDIIELLDINRKPVGAIYLSKFKYREFSISETSSSEKYYLYVDGLGVYFSFYQKITTKL